MSAEWMRLAPFTKVEIRENSAVVRFQEKQYDLISVNDLSVAKILDHCRQQYRDKWDKRFAEDLVEVLAGAGHPMNADRTEIGRAHV